MKKRHIYIPIGILAAGFILMVLLLSMKSEPPKNKLVVQPRIVQAKVIHPEDLHSEIIAYGRLTSSQPVTLYSEVNGILNNGSVPFLPAVNFKKGDLLIQVDDRQTKLELNSLKSDFLNALASVLPEIKVDFPDEYDKYQDYFDSCNFESGLKELPETVNQKIKLFLTRFNVYKLFYSVRNMEITLEKHYFRAPFDGSVISADLRAGSTVRPGSIIGRIINMNDLEVEAPISTADLPWINKSQPVVLTSEELKGEWNGSIKRIGKNIDNRTQTVPVFIEIDRNGHTDLVNGVFMKAVLQGLEIPKAVMVPNRAVYNDNFVYLIREGALTYKKVEIARRQMDNVIIRNGIVKGDTLVTELLQGVAPGMPAVANTVTDPEGGL